MENIEINRAMKRKDIENWLANKFKDTEFVSYRWSWDMVDALKEFFSTFADVLNPKDIKLKTSRNALTVYYKGTSLIYVEVHKKMVKHGEDKWYGRGPAKYVYGSFDVLYLDNQTLGERIDYVLSVIQKSEENERNTMERAIEVGIQTMKTYNLTATSFRSLCEYVTKNWYTGVRDQLEAKSKEQTEGK